MSRFLVGLDGMLIFAIGAVLVGKAMNTFTTMEQIGFVLVVIGVYISGYFLAMTEQ